MKIGITAVKKDLSAKIDEKFGRAQYFAIYDTTTKQADFIENKHINDKGGVGSKIVELMANNNVEVVIANEFGPKAKDLLEQLKIKMVIPDDKEKSILELIENIK